MLKAKLVGPRQFEIERVPTPVPGRGEVLLRTAYVAICGSEFPSYWGVATKHPTYKHIVHYPRYLGHEASGVVEAVGPGVHEVKIGDRIVPRRAHYATHHIVPVEQVLTHIPREIPLKEASLTLMTQETCFIVDHVGIQPGDKVLIVGLGPLGLLILEALRFKRCTELAVADLVDHRLQVANELGAKYTVNSGTHDLVNAIYSIWPDGPNVVVDTTGRVGPMAQAIEVVAPNGKVVLAGRPYETPAGLQIEDLFDKMLTVYGAKTPPAGYTPAYASKALKRIAAGQVHAQRLITHEFPLRRIGDAFELATHPERGGLKIVVNCQESEG